MVVSSVWGACNEVMSDDVIRLGDHRHLRDACKISRLTAGSFFLGKQESPQDRPVPEVLCRRPAAGMLLQGW